jgi:hypothetical protein
MFVRMKYLTTLNIEQVYIQLLQVTFLNIIHKNKQRIETRYLKGGWEG